MILSKNGIRGSEFWINSETLSFQEILMGSRVPLKWSKFSLIEESFQDKMLKPVNRYVSNLYPMPELVSITGNTVRLRQKTHAEIWVDTKQKDLYALDKCWQRQFYPSTNSLLNDECFLPTYKFYMPWILDLNIRVQIEPAGKCFFTLGSIIELNINDKTADFIDVPFVDFKIFKGGDHMKTGNYGIIEIGTPMYDMVFDLTDRELEKLHEQYR